MKCKKETDYRRSNPELVYELKKVEIKLRKKNKPVKEISEITSLSDQTVRDLYKKYDEGGIAAIKPKKRGRKAGEKRHLSPTQEQELLGQLGPVHIRQMWGFTSKFSLDARQKFAGVLTYVKNF